MAKGIVLAILVFVVDIAVKCQTPWISTYEMLKSATFAAGYWLIFYLLIRKVMKTIPWITIRVMFTILFIGSFLCGIWIFDSAAGNLMVQVIKTQEYVLFSVLALIICITNSTVHLKKS